MNGKLEAFICQHALLRLPLFIQGVAAGLLTIRNEEYSPASNEDSWLRQTVNQIFPTNLSSESHASIRTKCTLPTDRNVVMFSLVIFYYVFRSFTDLGLPEINTYSQIFFSHLQLVIVLGLENPGDNSISKRVCQSKVCQFLGQISLSLFMIHSPVYKIVIVILAFQQSKFSTSIAALFLTILVATLTSNLVQRPLNKLFNRLQSKTEEVNKTLRI